jgi:hypothetical protein
MAEAHAATEAAPEVSAVELALLVDTLLPGDGLFPPAALVGAQALLAERLIRLRGAAALQDLAAAISTAGGPLGRLDEAGRRRVVADVQRNHSAMFDDVLRCAFLSYYEAPVVQDVIRSLGFTYHAMPLPGGYPEVGKFDAARDTPTHGRGAYIRTDAVRRVDVGKLAFLGGGDGK